MRGNFHEGMVHGKGKLIYKSGAVYRGYFTENRIEGFGCYTMVSKNRYLGSWLDCKLHGAAMILYKDGA